ncbi:MAG: substrate-binding domain-containing protein [Marmoricola sp.]
MRSAYTRQVKTGVAAFAVVAAMSGLAACGSDDPSGASDDSAGSAATVPAEVEATVTKYLGEAELGLEPLSAKPEPGKHVIYLANSKAPTDVTNGEYVMEAVETLGWTGDTINYEGDPASLSEALDQAVNEKPDAVVLSGQDPSAYANSLKKAGEAGVPVFVGGVPVAPEGMDKGGLTGVSLGSEFLTVEGAVSADWIIRDSGGTANVAVVTLAGFPTLEAEHKGFADELKKNCPSCKEQVVEVQISEIGKGVPATVVSTLQANPDIDYVYFPYGDVSIGVPAALAAANLNPKVTSSIASDNTYGDLKSGKAVMTMSTSSAVQGWLEVDLVARYFETNAPVHNESAPLKVYDETNSQADTLPISPEDYEDQFKKAWLLTS